MRVFLVLLLLTLMPLQFSAASAETRCGHVPGTQRQQAMHHQAGDGQADKGDEVWVAGDSGFDFDCGTCHANCAAAVTATIASIAISAGTERAEHLAERRSRLWHEQPYRPQWSAPLGSGWKTVA